MTRPKQTPRRTSSRTVNEMFVSTYCWFVSRMTQLRENHERGAAAVEYGLLVALIAVAVVAAIGFIGSKLNTTFCTVVAALPGSPVTCATPTP